MSTLRVSPLPVPTADDGGAAVTALLRSLGEDPSRAGLRGTPERLARSLDDLTAGSRLTPEEAVGGAIFPEDYAGLVRMPFLGRRSEFLAAVRSDVRRPGRRVPDPLG